MSHPHHPETWTAVCTVRDIVPNTGVCALVDDRQVAAFRIGRGDEVYAIDNFDPNHDSIELDHFANAQTFQQLSSLVTSDAHNNAVIDLGHSDTVTLNGLNPQQLQAVLGKLEDAGYASESSGSYGGSAAAQFTGAYDVGLSVVSASGSTTVTYYVTAPGE